MPEKDPGCRTQPYDLMGMYERYIGTPMQRVYVYSHYCIYFITHTHVSCRDVHTYTVAYTHMYIYAHIYIYICMRKNSCVLLSLHIEFHLSQKERHVALGTPSGNILGLATSATLNGTRSWKAAM